MNIGRWFKSIFTSRGKALALYRRGMRLARNREHEEAIKAYSAAIELNDAPSDVRAMALFNRGLVHMAMGDYEKSVVDLKTVIAMDDAPQNVKTMARQKLIKREAQHNREQA